MIVSLDNISEREWKNYLLSCQDATIYHTPEWMHVLVKTFDYEPIYVFSLDENDDINGMLPLMYVQSWITGNRFESLPFSHICSPLGNSDELVSELISKYFQNGKGSIQINADRCENEFVKVNSYCTHILNLEKTKEEIWKGMDRGSTRWAVNKSRKEGVISEYTCSMDDLHDFYELNCSTKRELGVPCHPYEFFYNMMQEFNQQFKLYVAKYQGRIIGGGIMLAYNESMLYGYGAADSHHLKQYPYNSFIWKAIEDALEDGLRTFDFGRSAHSNTGLIQFKQKWGTERRELVYSYYPKNPNSIGSNRDGGIYHFANKIIQNTPMSTYKILSNVLFKHFG